MLYLSLCAFQSLKSSTLAYSIAAALIFIYAQANFAHQPGARGEELVQWLLFVFANPYTFACSADPRSSCVENPGRPPQPKVKLGMLFFFAEVEFLRLKQADVQRKRTGRAAAAASWDALVFCLAQLQLFIPLTQREKRWIEELLLHQELAHTRSCVAKALSQKVRNTLVGHSQNVSCS